MSQPNSPQVSGLRQRLARTCDNTNPLARSIQTHPSDEQGAHPGRTFNRFLQPQALYSVQAHLQTPSPHRPQTSQQRRQGTPQAQRHIPAPTELLSATAEESDTDMATELATALRELLTDQQAERNANTAALTAIAHQLANQQQPQQQPPPPNNHSPTTMTYRPMPPAPSRDDHLRLASGNLGAFERAEDWRDLYRKLHNRCTGYANTIAQHFTAQVRSTPLSQFPRYGTNTATEIQTAEEREAFAISIQEAIEDIPGSIFLMHTNAMPYKIRNCFNAVTDVLHKPQARANNLQQYYAQTHKALEQDLFQTLAIAVAIQPQLLSTLQTFKDNRHGQNKPANYYPEDDDNSQSPYRRITSAGTDGLWYFDKRFDPPNPYAKIEARIREVSFQSTGNPVADMAEREQLNIRITRLYTDIHGNVDNIQLELDRKVAMIICDQQDPDLHDKLMDKLGDGHTMFTDVEKLQDYIRQQSQRQVIRHTQKHTTMRMTDDYDQFEQISAAIDRPKACTNCSTWYDHDPVDCPHQCNMCQRAPGTHEEWCVRYKTWLRYKDVSKLQQPPSMPVRGGAKRGGSKTAQQSPQQKIRPKRPLSAAAARHIGELTVEEAKIRAERIRYLGDDDRLAECDQAANAVRAYKVELTELYHSSDHDFGAMTHALLNMSAYARIRRMNSNTDHVQQQMTHAPSHNVHSVLATDNATLHAANAELMTSMSLDDDVTVCRVTAESPSLTNESMSTYTKVSACVDSGATAGCAPDSTGLHVQDASVGVTMANNGHMTVSSTGHGTMFAPDVKNRMCQISTGRTLVHPKLHRLLSPAAMIMSPNGIKSAYLAKEDSSITLQNGSIIPLRFTGKAWYLDYFARKSVADNDDVAGTTLSDTIYSIRVEPAQAFNVDTSELQMDSPVPTVLATPAHHRVIEPAGLSFSGLEHRRYGHQSYSQLNATRKLKGLPLLRLPPPGWRCAICELSNARQRNVAKRAHEQANVSTACACQVCVHNAKHTSDVSLGESISMDLFGPSRIPSLDGSIYGSVIVEKVSGFIDVDGLKRKNDTVAVLQRYRQNFPASLKEVHTDGGSEFLGNFMAYCRGQNIRQTFTCPYSSFENGKAEAAVGIVKRGMRRNLLESGLPDQFWLRAADMTCIQHNQSSSKRTPDRTPHMIRWGTARRERELQVLGALAYTLIVPDSARTSQIKYPAFAGYFVGFATNSNAFLIWDRSTGKIKPRRDVRIDEHWRMRKVHPTWEELSIPVITHPSQACSGASLTTSKSLPQKSIAADVAPSTAPVSDGSAASETQTQQGGPMQPVTHQGGLEPEQAVVDQGGLQSVPHQGGPNTDSQSDTCRQPVEDQGHMPPMVSTTLPTDHPVVHGQDAPQCFQPPSQQQPTIKQRVDTSIQHNVQLRNTGKAQRIGRNKAIMQRTEYIHGKTFSDVTAAAYQYTANNGELKTYTSADLKYDISNGFLQYDSETAAATFPRGFGSDSSRVHRSSRSDDTARALPMQTEKVAKHLSLCAGTMQDLVSALTADPTAVGLAVDLNNPNGPDHSDLWRDVPAHVVERITYLRYNLESLSYSILRNMIRDHLHCTLSQLSTVHFSPPCTTYTSAHHGKNPHRVRYAHQSMQGIDDDTENVHRLGMKPISDMAHQHDRLNESVLDCLRQLAKHSYKTVISIENPHTGVWKDMPFVKRILGSPGWIIRTADHCMHRRTDERIYPRKRSTWLLYNVNTDIPLRQCDATCGCVVPGTNYHRLLVCNRADQHAQQTVMKDVWRVGQIPLGLFDLIRHHRSRSAMHKEQPNQQLPQPVLPLDEAMIDTGKARDASIIARCRMINGKSFRQIEGQKYISKYGLATSYTQRDLRSDLQQGYLRLQFFDKYEQIRSVSEQADMQQDGEDMVNAFIETACYMTQGTDPVTVKEALQRGDAEAWKAAIWKEIEALIRLKCWRLRQKSEKEDDPIERVRKLYKSKVVLKSKPPQNGMEGRKKARLCVSDPKFLQKLVDVDCFSPMCRLETVRFLLTCVVERDWALGSLDIGNAFPTANLPEPVWMEVPQFLIDQTEDQQEKENLKNSYCYVEKALYGLGHSPRCFNKHLDAHLTKHGYESTEADTCLYVKYDDTGSIVIAIATFVDDLIFGGKADAISQFRQIMIKTDTNPEGFQITDHGVPTDFLGFQIEFNQKHRSIKIHSAKYIEKLAERHPSQPGEIRSKASVPLPYDRRLEPRQADEPACDPTAYRSLVGELVFAAMCTRADICHHVRELAKFMYDPSDKHLKAARQCLAYLIRTKTDGIKYVHGSYTGMHGNTVPNGICEMFTDASFAEDLLTRVSQSGYCCLKNKAVFSWGAKGQDKVALSTGDAELRALADAYREVQWIRKLMHVFTDRTTRETEEKRILTRQAPASDAPRLPPTTIWEDNQATINWIMNPVQHSKIKHIDVPTKAIRQAQNTHHTIDVKYIRTHLQLADILTKNLCPAKHYQLAIPMLNLDCSAPVAPSA